MSLEVATGVMLLVLLGAYELRLLILVLRRPGKLPVSTFDAMPKSVFLKIGRDDCDFGLIWETQRNILQFLSRAGRYGVRREELNRAFHEMEHCYPELCEGRSVLDWVRWAESEELVICKEDRVMIAELGEFLLYDLDKNHDFAEQRCV